ncbi:spherulation-specific family 4 protein [Nonomuraea sp. MTCD27]|uniref:spherulation-specific family 4 protein n=1 Tax=Nonomuraea sp. MTCD27 TaxID=1676747 RepID=UPI0035BEF994
MFLRRAAAVAVLLLGSFTGTAHASSSADEPGLSLAVPAYFYPGELWGRLSDPGVGIVVANPFSGPGKDFDPNYAKAISDARAAGVTVLGYVATGYLGSTGRATRLGETTPLAWLAQAQQDVARWYDLYGAHGLGGVFLDEVQNVCGPGNAYSDTYRALDESIKSLHRGAFTVINPGIGTDECYADIADVSLTFEGTYETYQGWQPPAWQRGRDPRRFWHLVHATATQEQMEDALRLAKERGAGHVYVTPDVLANPWDTLPDYWRAELDAARSPDTGAPARPGPATAVKRGPTSLTLAWRPSPGAVGYDVHLDGLRVTGTAGRVPAVTVKNLDPGTAYTVTVKARDAAGNASAAGAAVSLRTRKADAAPPATPAGLGADQVKVASVRLAWERTADTAWYDVLMDGRRLLRLPAALLPADATVPVTGLTPATSYTFTVLARDASGNESAPARPLTVTTAVPSGDPISEAAGSVADGSATYQARYNLPFDFHHVYIDADNDAATGFAVAGIGADYLIENSWYYRHAGSGWNWTPVDLNPLVSSADDLFVWRVPLTAPLSVPLTGAHRVVFHGSGSSPEAYSPIVPVS